jgi:hypothetical protein
MNLFARSVVVLFPLGALWTACVFDSKGLPATGDMWPADLADAYRPDKPRADTTPTSVCSKVPAPTDNVCSFGSDPVGASGTCVSGAFERARFCFALAPCQGGTCRPMCTSDCRASPCGATEVCTALFASAAVIKHCCVEPTAKNGNKSAEESCSKNEQCLSGLCNVKAGNCFQPCFGVGQCPQGFSCDAVEVREGKLTFNLTGCVKVAVDAGPDSVVPDSGPDSAVPDAAVPDAGVPDAAVPDAAVPDAQAVDTTPTPDTAPPVDAAPLADLAADAGIDS